MNLVIFNLQTPLVSTLHPLFRHTAQNVRSNLKKLKYQAHIHYFKLYILIAFIHRYTIAQNTITFFWSLSFKYIIKVQHPSKYTMQVSYIKHSFHFFGQPIKGVPKKLKMLIFAFTQSFCKLSIPLFSIGFISRSSTQRSP